MDDKPKQRRGFATWSPEKRAAVAAMGGRSVPPDKRSFSQNPTLASDAGRVGGMRSKGGGRKPK